MSIIYFWFGHWIGDFLLQNRYMAENKSNSMTALTLHVLAYSSAILCFSLLYFASPLEAIVFTVLNGAIHMLVDYFTSKLSGHFYEKRNVHGFFSTIGFDQWLHLTTIVLTLELIKVL